MQRQALLRSLFGDPQMRAQPPSNRLSFEDAIVIWQRHWNGEFQNRIAADYDVNPGRVNEILKEQKHVGSKDVALTVMCNV
jgi:hypothetical protein